MNKEIMKAMNKNEHKMRKWWDKNSYKVFRVIFFPVYFYAVAKDRITDYLREKIEWDENRATEIFNYYIPRAAEWDSDDNTFYFFNNGMGWQGYYAKRRIKMKDRRFWKKFSGYKMREYLIDKFELEGFTKVLGDCSGGWTEVRFILNEKKG